MLLRGQAALIEADIGMRRGGVRTPAQAVALAAAFPVLVVLATTL